MKDVRDEREYTQECDDCHPQGHTREYFDDLLKQLDVHHVHFE